MEKNHLDITQQTDMAATANTLQPSREQLVDDFREANLGLVEAMRQTPTNQGLVERRRRIADVISRQLSQLATNKA